MTYHHEFTIDAAELVDILEYEDVVFTLSFDINPDGDIEEFDLIGIDGEPVSELEINFIEGVEGYGPFWDIIEDACEEEKDNLLAGWAEDAEYAKAEQRYNARHADDGRMADMGMDVPAR